MSVSEAEGGGSIPLFLDVESFDFYFLKIKKCKNLHFFNFGGIIECENFILSNI